ncbi:MAG: hypothetical protein ABIK73_06765 [candidate division WOR-3 bacterium]
MPRSYFVFWFCVIMAIIAGLLLGGFVIFRFVVKPALSPLTQSYNIKPVIQILQEALKTQIKSQVQSQVKSQIKSQIKPQISQDSPILSPAVKEAIEGIISNSVNPIISFIPKSQKYTQKPKFIVLVGISGQLSGKLSGQTSYSWRPVLFSSVEYMRQIKNSDFYWTIGISVPFRQDSIINKTAIKFGLAWLH